MKRISCSAFLAIGLLGLTSCSTMKRGYDSVAKSTGAAWDAVADGTMKLGKKTAEAAEATGRTAARAATGQLKPDPAFAEITISLNRQKGVIGLELNEKAAPAHVANFRKLVKDGYYNGLGVHRAVPGTLIQTGDPRSKSMSARSVWGLGGPGYTVPQEIKLPHKRGSVGMARIGDRLNPTRQSNGSQFYISLKPMPELDGAYTVFGEVVSGLAFAEAIANTAADENDAPLRMVKVESIRLVESRPPELEATQAAAAAAPAAEISEPIPDSLDEPAPAAPAASPLQKPKGFWGRLFDRFW